MFAVMNYENELESFFGQQIVNLFALAAIQDMGETGLTFDEAFPLSCCKTPEKRKFREAIREAVAINLLPIGSASG
jgi:hypothetical protein